MYKGKITDITIESLPVTPEDFIGLREKIAQTPEGGVAVFVTALLKYAEDQKVGEQFLTIGIDRKWLVDKPAGFKGKSPSLSAMQNLRMRIADKSYVARSYIKGTSPENGYQYQPPLIIKILEQDGDQQMNARQKDENGLVKLFVYSSGADRPRPIQVKQNDKGVWKAYSWSSLETGVRPPIEKIEDDI